MQSNDHLQMVPQTVFEHRKLTFDFPGLEIGIAEYAEGPTGCTVFSFPQGVPTAIDVRGGATVTTMSFDFNHAICFAGGSILGLEAAAGVTAGIFAHDGYTFDHRFPLVSGGILYDLALRDNTIYPDRTLGRAAFEVAKPSEFLLGRRGAGRSATVGGTFDSNWSETSGQGAAFREIGVVKIAVFTVVNASGCVYNRQGKIIRGNFDGTIRHSAISHLEHILSERSTIASRQGNTTLTLVATNQKLKPEALTQMARQVHSSLARVIQPFHTEDDGDVLYAVTTNEVEALGTVSTSTLASEIAWDAVLSIFEE